MMLEEMGKRAKAAARVLATLGREKTKALEAAAQALRQGAEEILQANALDLAQAKETGLAPAMLDRLALNPQRIEDMARAVELVAAEPDPVGRVLSGSTTPRGLSIRQVTVPLGVVGIIYEARPNVTSDGAALCLKAGNAVILRGGKEAIRSNLEITRLFRQGLEAGGLPGDCLQLVEDTSRASATALMELTGYLDVLIPRGGAGLIQSVTTHAKVPVIETGVGNCHVYVDETADCLMAAEIVFNAKTTRPSVCNAAETLLVHEAAAEKALPMIAARLWEKQVEIRGCERTLPLVPGAIPAEESDWSTEFLDQILAVKVVSSLEEALSHIAKYSTGHSECIVTESLSAARRFQNEVDSAAVYVNASTRFTDGGEFGLGAEIGISTQKLHARGPMGLAQLVSYKFLIQGIGNIR